MDTTTTPERGALLGRSLTAALLLAGPYLTVMLVLTKVGSPWLRADQVSMVLTVALVFWSPVLFSFPAMLLQDARDRALPQFQGPLESVVRGVVLVPYLLLSPRSGVRLETAMSLVGLLVGYLVAAPHLTW